MPQDIVPVFEISKAMTNKYLGNQMQKTPLWGSLSEGKSKFSYPSFKEFQQMPADLRLAKINFFRKMQGEKIIDCKVTFSDGSSRSVLKKYPFQNLTDLEFKFNKGFVRLVQAKFNPTGVSKVSFFGKNTNKELFTTKRSQCVGELLHNYQSFEIEDNEEIIGIYGSYNSKELQICQLGFILKVRNE